MSDAELCKSCGNKTGKAGKDEDSFYLKDEGPFCQVCFEYEAKLATYHRILTTLPTRKRMHDLEKMVDLLYQFILHEVDLSHEARCNSVHASNGACEGHMLSSQMMASAETLLKEIKS